MHVYALQGSFDCVLRACVRACTNNESWCRGTDSESEAWLVPVGGRDWRKLVWGWIYVWRVVFKVVPFRARVIYPPDETD